MQYRLTCYEEGHKFKFVFIVDFVFGKRVFGEKLLPLCDIDRSVLGILGK